MPTSADVANQAAHPPPTQPSPPDRPDTTQRGQQIAGEVAVSTLRIFCIKRLRFRNDAPVVLVLSSSNINFLIGDHTAVVFELINGL